MQPLRITPKFIVMKESYLHYIWKHQKIEEKKLSTQAGQWVEVYGLGQHNDNEGPDFLNAKIRIDEITWHGHVEIHVNSSDWDKHLHQENVKYNNVILHVVWNHDKECYREDGERLQVLELKDNVNPSLIDQADYLTNSNELIACNTQLDQVKSIYITAQLDAVGIERLNAKSNFILELLNKNKGSWEDTAFQVIAKNFGFKRNAESFYKLGLSIPYKILSKHALSHNDLETLLYGMAGFLDKPVDDYQKELKSEYDYLSAKYNLADRQMLRVEWDFHRMRPSNFPTIRLSQFAAMMAANVKWFNDVIHFSSKNELIELFRAPVSSYWQEHYDFGKKSSTKHLSIGSSSVDNILINTVAPLLVGYGRYVGQEAYLDKAIALLQEIKSERNKIIDQWKNLGVMSENAFYSQSILQLNNEYCLKKRCLSCKIGTRLIHS